jgi:hypothetical protein
MTRAKRRPKKVTLKSDQDVLDGLAGIVHRFSRKREKMISIEKMAGEIIEKAYRGRARVPKM